MLMECNAMPHPTAHLMNELIFRELVYEDSNLPKLIEILILNKVGLRVTVTNPDPDLELIRDLPVPVLLLRGHYYPFMLKLPQINSGAEY